MPNHRKHFSRWFTTSTMRAINLDLVTDITITKSGQIVTGGIVYQAVTDQGGQTSLSLDGPDTTRLLELLES